MDEKLLELKRSLRPRVPNYSEVVRGLEDSVRNSSTSERKKGVFELIQLSKMSENWTEPINYNPLEIELAEETCDIKD